MLSETDFHLFYLPCLFETKTDESEAWNRRWNVTVRFVERKLRIVLTFCELEDGSSELLYFSRSSSINKEERKKSRVWASGFKSVSVITCLMKLGRQNFSRTSIRIKTALNLILHNKICTNNTVFLDQRPYSSVSCQITSMYNNIRVNNKVIINILAILGSGYKLILGSWFPKVAWPYSYSSPPQIQKVA